jgi:hypothetical protein
MAKENRRRNLIITVLILAMLTFSAYAAVISPAHAAEATLQEKGLSVLNKVVGIDTAKYSVTTKQQQGASFSYLDVVPLETVAYDLTSENSKLKALYTFANGKVEMIQTLEREGSPSLVKPANFANDVALAEVFLSNFQTYTANPLFGELKSTLIDVVPGKNLTKASGNMVLEATANDGCTYFKWYYTANGAVAPYSKFVTLGFKDGFLEVFVDNWQLYNVGSTNINLSEEEAVTIALDAAKAHFLGKLEADALDAKNFNDSNVRWTSLVFDHSLNANKTRSEDALELYPVRRVGIALNKWYGQMYGIEVDIWADTKEVRSVQEAWSTLPPPEGAPIAYASQIADVQLNLILWITLPTLAIISGISLAWKLRQREANALLRKPHLTKSVGTLLCVLMLSVTVLASASSTVSATRVGIVWGSESAGAYGWDPPNNFTWRKNQTEISYQHLAAANISQWFSANGYNGVNHQGSSSTRLQIIDDLQNTNYGDYLAVVDFDHGVGGFPSPNPLPSWLVPSNEFHYMFEDNVGTVTGPWSPSTYPPRENHPENAVYDLDVYLTLSGSAKAVFAFINTCYSACIADYVGNYYAEQRWETSPGWPYVKYPVGMPLGWTGRLVADIDTTQGFNTTDYISADGFSDPDMGPQVYIGFPFGSASLMQKIPYPYGNNPYYDWVYSFFWYALNNDISVNQALDSATAMINGQYFRYSSLHTGFTAYWWHANPETMDDCTMAVYGNGNIHLKNYVPPSHSVAVRSLSGPSSGDIGVSYQFSASAADSQDHEVRYLFDWGDGNQTLTDYYPSYATVNVNHTWSSQDVFNVKVKAQCENGVWSSWSSPKTIHIGNFYWLYVDAYDDCYGWELYPYVYVDGEQVGRAPVLVQVTEGWHTVYVEDPYVYWYLVGLSDGYGNGASRPIYSDTGITAWYWPMWN